MVPEPICSLGHGRSLWTNWRWTNFSLSYQLPLSLCSKGRSGYWRNLKPIYRGLPLWAMCRKIIGWLSALISSSKGNATCQLLSGVRRFTDTVYRDPLVAKLLVGLLCRLHFPTVSPRVIRWMDGVTSLSPFLGPLYRCIPSLAPHISHNFLSANSSKSLV